MELRVSSALTLIALLAFAPGLSAKGETIKIATAGGGLAAPAEAAATTTGHSPASPSCAITEMVRATPPPTNNAGPIGEGLWWVNDDRSIWMQSATGPWHIGLNQKNMMIKPSGLIVTVSGTRIDAPAPPVEVRGVPQGVNEFQTMALTFPTDGCWKITATGAGHRLEFVTRVLPRP